MSAMRRRRFVVWLLGFWLLGQGGVSALAADRPNLVVILVDDLGPGDYSAFGTSDIKTPNIDRLFREGLAFDNFYASCCVCSPTRAALLTGCDPDRVGVPGVIRTTPENSWGWLAPGATLLPELLKPAGYRSAIIGKWHLGLESPNTPTERGFDHFHGFLGDMMDDYWTHRRDGQNFMRLGNQVIDPEGHATDLFTDWACQWITEQGRMDNPFFLYLAYNAPHDPIQPPPDWLQKVRARAPQMPEPRAKLVAFIEHLDHGIGRVLQTLEQTGLAGQTLVVFTSDNGGRRDLGANNGPWRSEKGHMYEGGLRVPCAFRWPGVVPRSAATARPSATIDLFPTLLEAAGVERPAAIDGISLLDTLRGDQAPNLQEPRDLYFVRREGGLNFGGKTIEALRRGDWKLVQDNPFGPYELFHLKSDPYEKTDLSKREPARVAELAAALRARIQRGGVVPWQPSR